MFGWTGKLLRVNLTRGDYALEELDMALVKKFIGGRGLAVKIFFDEIDPRVEPLSEENKMVFLTAPLVGTGAPSADGCWVVTRSPLTGAIATGRFGGEFGTELKFAGYDGIIIEGKAARPVYLVIRNDKIEFRPAEHLWGKSTHETDDAVKAAMRDKWEARDTHVACVGPAGENLVKISSIVADKDHVAARSGMGAVMGFKNLKAIAVRGTNVLKVADPEGFYKATLTLLQRVKDSVILSDHLRNYGKINVQYQANLRAAIAVRNFQECSFPGVTNTNARPIAKNYLRRGISCYSCPVACVRLTEVKTDPNPKFIGKGGGPEFQTCTMLGADCGVDNLAAILKANYLCNELGMDTISVGGTIACAMDMFEHGYLTEEDTGCQLKFGNAEALVDMTEKMGRREGFGDILAEGGYRMAERFGHPEFFMGVKKQELPAWNAQVLQGAGLEFSTANNGACHTKGGVFNSEVWGIPVKLDRFATEGKAPIAIDYQNKDCIRDAHGLCSLLTLTKIDDVALDLLNTVTGIGYTPEDLKVIGERTWNLERLFNVKAGFSARDDVLPRRMMEEPMQQEGPCKGVVNRLFEMRPEYYRLRGWDENGIPKPEKLAQLGLA
ncbi:MAG: aldehyde ferredoxin oxidoreductase family protein [Chloroflexi bacterium]|nr:aldehyde ferredoxin oxidoreductase family protein [Chloroflexota bacterium]